MMTQIHLFKIQSAFKVSWRPQHILKRFHCGDKGEIDNLSAVIHGINDLRLENRPIPVTKPNQVLVQMESVGICGSDVQFLVKGRIGPFIIKKPMVIGHEGCGTVVKTGKQVENLKIGDRVAIEPGVPCRKCQNCREGRYHLCPQIYFCATPPDDGLLQRFYAHDADFCFKLADNMDFDEGAAVEPLACACRACRRGKVKIGSNIMILGCGPVGLMTLMASKAMGADGVVVLDNKLHRLEKSKELGADHIIDISGMEENEIVEKVFQLLNCKPSISFECSGAELSVRIGMMATRTGGKFIIVGCGADQMRLPFMPAALSEIDMLGVFRYVNEYPTAIGLISSKKVKAKTIITHHFSMEESASAFDIARTGKCNPIKIIIHPNSKWKASVSSNT
ncbi:sorbitol dehydrogenase-like isoform X2 [Harmonia axyridis]|uniref:sorbitol dehydrogenase-like isoform X2 n=1 Tax=Harmonia axyridis TaxID=115357 RepID=UPI001E279894|nr:sorbitol dehydrogenase-like isoform X2 [Harmonia axyridis]